MRRLTIAESEGDQPRAAAPGRRRPRYASNGWLPIADTGVWGKHAQVSPPASRARHRDIHPDQKDSSESNKNMSYALHCCFRCEIVSPRRPQSASREYIYIYIYIYVCIYIYIYIYVNLSERTPRARGALSLVLCTDSPICIYIYIYIYIYPYV